MDRIAHPTAAVLRALRERDEGTFTHCDRSSALAVEIGMALKLAARELEALRLAAELHDVGKIGIPDRVLHKPGRLDDEELRLMRTHAQRGHDILVAIPGTKIAAVAGVALHHHEAVDGSGYPVGLKGEAIPLLARIVCIVDSYDALATPRPYHAPKSHAQVMRMLYDQQGGKYDAHVLAAFARVVEHSPYRAGD
jgi:HD-GYP domain-containing protein (c-di-GMP phosphodiesterase class II)